MPTSLQSGYRSHWIYGHRGLRCIVIIAYSKADRQTATSRQAKQQAAE